jgi:hypothetical protein
MNKKPVVFKYFDSMFDGYTVFDTEKSAKQFEKDKNEEMRKKGFRKTRYDYQGIIDIDEIEE